jgi:hypothetical protein
MMIAFSYEVHFDILYDLRLPGIGQILKYYTARKRHKEPGSSK